MLPSSKQRSATGGRSEQSGFILMLMLFTTLAALLVGALALDAGRLYFTRMSLQKLADSAALGVVGYTIHAGPSRVAQRFGGATLADLRSDQLTELAEEIVEANVREFGWRSIADAHLTVSARSVPPVNPEHVLDVEVQIDRPMRYLLIDKLPATVFDLRMIAGQTQLAAAARSGRKIASVSAILDASRSMACPTFESCECLSPQRIANCSTPTKMHSLIDAVRAFVDRFDLNRDRLQFVPFQLVARGYTVSDLVTFAREQGFNIPYPPDIPDPLRFQPLLDQLFDTLKARNEPVGRSNFCDGLIEAEKLMDREMGGSAAPRAYVIFTDGAPTAMTFDAASPSALAQDPAGSGKYKYVSFSNDWSNATGRWPAPSALASREFFRTLDQEGLGFDDVDPPPGSTPACGPAQSPVVRNNSRAELNSALQQVFGRCVNNLGFILPNGLDAHGNVIPYGSGALPDDPATEDWRKQYFNCALKQSDIMRSRAAIFYVIGLGSAAPPSSDCYQNVDDTQSRHDYFLARLANDYDYAKQQNSHPECRFSGFGAYQDWHDSPDPRYGKYFPISPGDDIDLRLAEAYTQIAIKIQLSLLS